MIPILWSIYIGIILEHFVKIFTHGIDNFQFHIFTLGKVLCSISWNINIKPCFEGTGISIKNAGGQPNIL